MKRISSPCKKLKLQIVSLFLFLACASFLSQSAYGTTFNLTATWNANTESNVKEYRLYRTDGARTLIGSTPHPNTSYAFTATVPDGSAGTLSFALTAVDVDNNESTDSNSAAYSYDLSTITLSGYVRDSSGVGISGAVMEGLPNSPVTDVNGYYSATVSYGGSGTVTPSKSGYTFTPSSRSYSNVTSNQTGQDFTGTISEVVSPPLSPSGASSGYAGTSYRLSTTGSSSSLGSSHPVEYRFDWGDGTSSPWGSPYSGTYSQYHAWTLPGTYSVRAQARCITHPDNVSAWSSVSSISLFAKPFIQLTSPNGGENLVMGAPYTIAWSSAYLSVSGTLYLFYSYGGTWHPIAMLSPGEASFKWTIPRIPENATSPKPPGTVRTTSLWIGNWVNGKWECYDRKDYGFGILYDAWLCKVSGGDAGGATLLFDNGLFDGYGISSGLGMFRIEGTYVMNLKGGISGAYVIYAFDDRSAVFYTGNVTGGIDSSSKKMTLGLTTSDGSPVFSLSGVRLPEQPAIPGQWVANLSGSASGSLTSLEIYPHQLGDEFFSYLFEFSGSGSVSGGGPINIAGYFYLTSATMSPSDKTNVYGIYQITDPSGEEIGVFSGALNLLSGTISFTLTGPEGNQYFLDGQRITP